MTISSTVYFTAPANTVPAAASMVKGQIAVNTVTGENWVLDAAGNVIRSGNVTSINGKNQGNIVLSEGDIPGSVSAVYGGINSVCLLMDGKVYSAHGDYGYQGLSSHGRGSNSYELLKGCDNFQVVPIPTSFKIVQLGYNGGSYHALDQAGNLFAWGYNGYGQLGNGNTTEQKLPVLVQAGVTFIFSHPSTFAYDYTGSRVFIMKNDGYVYAAGYNAQGQLGIGNTTATISVFTKVTSLGLDVKSIYVFGNTHGYTFAIKSNGTIWATGYNTVGQLGTGNTSMQTSFVDVTAKWNPGKVAGGTTVLFGSNSSNANGYGATYALNTNNGVQTLYAAGYNAHYQLMNGNNTNQSTPVAANLGVYTLGNPIVSMGVHSTSTSHAILMATSGGMIYGAGHNENGILGPGAVNGQTTRNLVMAGGPNIVRTILSDGFSGTEGNSSNTAFIRQIGATDHTNGVYAIGYNAYGDLANGGTVNSATFTKISGVANLKQLTYFRTWSNNVAYSKTYVGITDDGRVVAWGANERNGVTSQHTTHVLLPMQVTINKAGV